MALQGTSVTLDDAGDFRLERSVDGRLDSVSADVTGRGEHHFDEVGRPERHGCG